MRPRRNEAKLDELRTLPLGHGIQSEGSKAQGQFRRRDRFEEVVNKQSW
jgi:hypothetical protein